MSPWFDAARRRLESAGFVIEDSVPAGGLPIVAVARRSRFELTKFGFSETFFVFAQFDNLDQAGLKLFSSRAFQLAKRLKRIPLPCGLFESVWCFSVAIVRSIDPASTQAIRNDAPPKHWAAAEIPVVYDASTGAVHSFEKTPLWGAAYYKGFRKQIARFLTGNVG